MAVRKLIGQGFGKEVCDALGLGARVRTIDIRIAISEAVTVKTESIMSDEQGRGLVNLLKEYVVVPRPSIINSFDDWFDVAKARAMA